MTTHTVYVYATLDYNWKNLAEPKSWRTDIWTHKAPDAETRIFLCELSVEAEMPPGFNPVPAQVAALKAERAEALAKYQEAVASVNERLSKLLCIEAPQETDNGKEFS